MADPLIDIYKEYKGPNITEEGHNKLIQLCLNSAIESCYVVDFGDEYFIALAIDVKNKIIEE